MNSNATMNSDATMSHAVYPDALIGPDSFVGSDCVCVCVCVAGGAFPAHRSGVLCLPGGRQAAVHGLLHRLLPVAAPHRPPGRHTSLPSALAITTCLHQQHVSYL